jgi:pimeloyl-ACP methyl ester carboxylesterase
MALYQRKLQRLSIAHDSQVVDTRFGQTHVLAIGPGSGPPLVALHGVHFGAPFMADFAGPFAEKFRIYIPDIVGQPGRSAEFQPAPSGHNYAGWLTDVLDGLGLDIVPLVGISFGGAVALDLAASAPERISRAVLMVPGGFARNMLASIAVLFRLFLGWQLYRLFPNRARLANVLHPLAWEMDEDYYEFFDAILRHVHWLIPPPGPFSREDLQRFRAPTAIYAARQDIFFPGDNLVREARTVIPNLVDAAVFESSHFPTNTMQSEVMRRMAAFLA